MTTEEEIAKLDASNGFGIDKKITRKKLSLPRGISFEDISTEANPTESIKDGMAYTHFFAHGLAEQTVIHLKDNDRNQLVS